MSKSVPTNTLGGVVAIILGVLLILNVLDLEIILGIFLVVVGVLALLK
ncbi:MAG: hypothetical protein ACPHID_05250 [Thermoplasmatota archaeon]